MQNHNQIIGELPPQRRAKIEGRARQLIGEEMALQQLRKARKLTQRQMARALKIGQDSVSRLESRSDLLISTLQSYVEAMGGELKITVEFKEGSAVISGLGPPEIADHPKKAKNKASVRRKRIGPRAIMTAPRRRFDGGTRPLSFSGPARGRPRPVSRLRARPSSW